MQWALILAVLVLVGIAFWISTRPSEAPAIEALPEPTAPTPVLAAAVAAPASAIEGPSVQALPAVLAAAPEHTEHPHELPREALGSAAATGVAGAVVYALGRRGTGESRTGLLGGATAAGLGLAAVGYLAWRLLTKSDSQRE